MKVLDNPFWQALTTEQASFALGNGPLRSFPGDVSPFCAVERDGQTVDAEPLRVAMAGSAVRYFVGQLPRVPAGVSVGGPITLLQMAGPATSGGDGQAAVRALGRDDVEAMLALTGLVFPGFFRRRTVEMGRYLGVFEAGALVAMGGERLAIPGYRELSAICTHPAHTGNGYGRTIIRRLASRIQAEGRVPFLHVRDTNAAARRLYDALGFTVVNTVRLITLSLEP
ncbi:MAG: GNAT family N-acetyltransferase [Vicinamibacterales bacterium]